MDSEILQSILLCQYEYVTAGSNTPHVDCTNRDSITPLSIHFVYGLKVVKKNCSFVKFHKKLSFRRTLLQNEFRAIKIDRWSFKHKILGKENFLSSMLPQICLLV